MARMLFFAAVLTLLLFGVSMFLILFLEDAKKQGILLRVLKIQAKWSLRIFIAVLVTLIVMALLV